MPESRLPKQLLFGELVTGRRSHGGQRKRFKDCLKKDLKLAGVAPHSFEGLAAERPVWRSKVRHLQTRLEDARHHLKEEKRRLRHQRRLGRNEDANIVIDGPR